METSDVQPICSEWAEWMFQKRYYTSAFICNFRIVENSAESQIIEPKGTQHESTSQAEQSLPLTTL